MFQTQSKVQLSTEKQCWVEARSLQILLKSNVSKNLNWIIYNIDKVRVLRMSTSKSLLLVQGFIEGNQESLLFKLSIWRCPTLWCPTSSMNEHFYFNCNIAYPQTLLSLHFICIDKYALWIYIMLLFLSEEVLRNPPSWSPGFLNFPSLQKKKNIVIKYMMKGFVSRYKNSLNKLEIHGANINAMYFW